MTMPKGNISQKVVESAPDPRRWLALAALGLSVLVVGLDVTVLNVALPTLAVELEAGTSELQWIADSYVVVFAALLLPVGLLGDRLGRKRVLLIGLAAFAAASALAAYSSDVAVLVAARALMGVGAAIVIPVSIAVVPSMFDGRERARAVAVLTSGLALGLPLGPLVGGWLLEHFWWGSVFLINIPTAAVALAATAFLMPESRDAEAPRLRFIPTLLSVAGLAALVYGIIEAPGRGWTDPLIVAAQLTGLAMLTAFALSQTKSRTPMVDLSLFANRGFLWGSIAAALAALAMMGVLFILPQYLQVVLDHSAFGTGLRLLPMIGGIMVAGILSARLVGKFGYRPVIVVGLGVFAAGFFTGTATTVDSGYGLAAAWMSIAGLGMGLTMVPATDAVLASLPRDREGAGTALMQTLRQVAGALGIAGLGAILSAVYSDKLSLPPLPDQLADAAEDSVAGAATASEAAADPAIFDSAASAFVDGMNAVFLACGVGAVLSLALIAVFFPRRLEPRPERAESDHDDPGTA
ncbi:MAG: DHA2 family efflux MFS transporter permease subunit [Stackebrandtia sp.]